MQEHRFSFTVDGTPDEVWGIMWKPMKGGIDTEKVKIEIYHPGDATGNGLVRHCWFPVPRYLFSGGRAQSWEWITESKRPVSWRYDAIGKPLWSKASGFTELTANPDGTTTVSCRETYEAMSRLTRFLERRVHRAISKDNDAILEGWIRATLDRRRQRAAAEATD